MPRYRYTATNAAGRTVRGTAEAPTMEALYIQLRDTKDEYMTAAKEDTAGAVAFRAMKTAQLADFCRNLGTLLAAGVPLVRAFRIMADERGLDIRSKALYEAVLNDLRRGVPLSDAMSHCAPAFPELLLAMTRSAETTGSIDESFLRMGSYYDREHRMNQQVGNSMMYPLILAVLTVGVLVVLMTFVVPQFKDMFDQMESLPFLTELLFSVSDLVATHWLSLALGIFVLVMGLRLLMALPAVRLQWDRLILHAPVVGKLNRKICTARFARTLSNLYSGGVPIVATLISARDAVDNTWIASQFDTVLRNVRAGHSLSDTLGAVDGFEKKMSASIAVGEETGKLDSLLATISETLDYEAESATKRLVTLLEPLMIVIMAVIVGCVVVAVIMPIYLSYGTIGGSANAI
ncbi:type II secretion system F family protein [uncultured Gemmiger sp.]|uniref:type II secretion system F family protein n=1 Tax=uncultured Gemmiger sp. TaxID=1623490 RepID=UPI0025E93D1F|nr:type II secretion system F family protein [uncultured Gemmiger sp.]